VKGGLHREDRKLSGAATASLIAAIRELNDGQPYEAVVCVEDMSTEEIRVARPLLKAALATMDEVEALRVAPTLPLVRTA